MSDSEHSNSIASSATAGTEQKQDNPTSSTLTTDDKFIADEYKNEGNKAFQAGKYQAALALYTKAIDVDSTNAVYLSNRAFCQLKLENYGLAIADADAAIAADRTFIKAYYRRGAAHLALAKYKDALKDFKQVIKIKPSDKDAQSKLKECEKAIRAEAFLKAIESDRTKPASETVKVEDMVIDSSYDGPRLDENDCVTLKFVTDLIEWYKSQKRLARKIVYQILLQVIKLLQTLPSLVDIVIPEGAHFTVCGDVHGQFYDVCNIFNLNGLPSENNPYLFNGDFVDRGSFSVEVIMVFFSFKLLYPNHFHMTRGNHESLNMNSIYGFQGEVVHKIDSPSFDLFTEAFNWLPLAYCIGSKVLVLHGGLFSEDGVTLDDIRRIDRNRQPPESGLMCDLLWSDPADAPGRTPSKRGVGLSFGPDVVERFLKQNNLEMIVRSHEVKEDGYEVFADGKLVTIFSAPNYVDQMGNKGAWIKFDHHCKPTYHQFNAVPHPHVPPMQYASGLMR